MSIAIIPATSSAPRRWTTPTLHVVTMSAAENGGIVSSSDILVGAS